MDARFRQGKKEFALAAVSSDGHFLKCLKPTSPQGEMAVQLRARTPTPLAQTRKDGLIPLIQPDLSSDREIVLRAVGQNGDALQHAPLFAGDREVAMRAVSSNGQALRHVAPFLQGDPSVVLAAVRNSGNALWHADPELLRDPQFMVEASGRHARALVHAHPTLLKDRVFLRDVLNKNGLCLLHLEPEFRNDRELVLAAVRQNGLALQYASPERREDREVVAAASMQNGHAFQHAATSLRDDRKAMLRSISVGPFGLQHGTPNNRADFEFMVDASHRPGGQASPYVKAMQRPGRDEVLKMTANHWLPQAEPKPQSTGAALRIQKHALKHARRGHSQNTAIRLRTSDSNIAPDFYNERCSYLALGASAPTRFE